MTSVDEAVQMSVEQAIVERRSVRGFLDRPVPPEVLRKVFELAQRAPSNCNTQPWHALVASGKTRDRIRDAMIKNIKNGVAPNPDYEGPPRFESLYRRRQIDCAVALYNEMGITREDVEGRKRAALRNFELFDAPHVAFFGMHKAFGSSVAIDVGIYLQTVMLAMTAAGISSCPQGSMRNYPDIVRAEFGVGEEIRILAGLSFGYEDTAVPANRTRISRADLSENVIFKD